MAPSYQRQLLLFLVLFSVEPAAAQEIKAPPESQTSRRTVNCAKSAKSLDCKAQQAIVLANTRQLISRLSVSRADDGRRWRCYFIFLTACSTRQASKALDYADAETLAIQTCDANGCYADSSLPADKLAALMKGAKFNVAFQDLKKQKITVPVPLKGLEDAVKKL